MIQPLYVIGHKNPDTDSICSSIAYAYLKQSLNEDAIACRQGPINNETRFVLNKFNVEPPFLIRDARSQARDIELDPAVLLDLDTTVHEAWKLMATSKSRSLFMIDKNSKIQGVISASNLSMLRLTPIEIINEYLSKATFKDISTTIDGKTLYEPLNFSFNGKVVVITSEDLMQFREDIIGSIVITSADEQILLDLLDMDIKAMVVTLSKTISKKVIDKAKRNKIGIISSYKTAMGVANRINESFKVSHVMSKDIVCYRDNEYLSDIEKKMLNFRYRSYPVLDKDDRVIGSISRYHLQNYKKKKFVLVDHSSLSQTIDHIDEAYLQEIIDHHHIGGIQTDHPIYYRNQICGCTCTIVYQIYKEKNVQIPKDIAGLMLSAIISDTLHFKSKTTTEFDIEAANKLSKIANIDIDTYAPEVLGASVSLVDIKPLDIITRDLKTYFIAEYKIAIGQANYNKLVDLQKVMPSVKQTVKEETKTKGYDLFVMMFTNVNGNGSIFIYSGKQKTIMKDIIEAELDSNTGSDSSIISRKQQLLPLISNFLKKY